MHFVSTLKKISYIGGSMKYGDEINKYMSELFSKELAPQWNAEKKLLEWGNKALSDGDFLKAKSFFESVLYINKNSSKAKNKLAEVNKKLIQPKKEKVTKLIGLIDKLKSLKSSYDNQLQYEVFILDAVRGTEKKTNIHNVNDKIIFSIDIPREGILTVFQYDEKGNIRLIFPSSKTDDVNVTSGENKRFGIKVSKPVGKHSIKTILILKEKTKPKEGDYKIQTALSKLIEATSELENEEWMEAIYEYQVVDK